MTPERNDWRSDHEFQDVELEAVHQDGDGYVIEVNDGMCLGVPGEVEPKPGDVARFFPTAIMGVLVRGVVLPERDEVLFYRTPQQQQAHLDEQVRAHDRERWWRFIQNRRTLDRQYKWLPVLFRARIDRFRASTPMWRVDFEAYEMRCCVDAVRIVGHVRRPEMSEAEAAEAIRSFHDSPWEERANVVDTGHSNNSLAFAVRLALHWVLRPSLVVLEHGAMVLLVGCEEYGCFHGEARS